MIWEGIINFQNKGLIAEDQWAAVKFKYFKLIATGSMEIYACQITIRLNNWARCFKRVEVWQVLVWWWVSTYFKIYLVTGQNIAPYEYRV